MTQKKNFLSLVLINARVRVRARTHTYIAVDNLVKRPSHLTLCCWMLRGRTSVVRM